MSRKNMIWKITDTKWQLAIMKTVQQLTNRPRSWSRKAIILVTKKKVINRIWTGVFSINNMNKW
jgi:hypothetical protein